MVGVFVLHASVLETLLFILSYRLKSYILVEEFDEYNLKKIPKVVRFALVLRYHSISSNKILLDDFAFPSLSLLEKISSGLLMLQSVNRLWIMREKYLRMCLLLNESYPQKCENILLGIPCFKCVNFQKITWVFHCY